MNNIEWYTEDNKDDLDAAIDGLNRFCCNWCMNCEETEKQKDLVFRCKDCVFVVDTENQKYPVGSCLVKIFARDHKTDLSKFGCMR